MSTPFEPAPRPPAVISRVLTMISPASPRMATPSPLSFVRIVPVSRKMIPVPVIPIPPKFPTTSPVMRSMGSAPPTIRAAAPPDAADRFPVLMSIAPPHV
jgi:hypothetical protein